MDVLQVKGELPELERVKTLGSVSKGCLSFEGLTATWLDQADIHQGLSDDRYLLLYTSMTTAGPKGLPHIFKLPEQYAGFGTRNANWSGGDGDVHGADVPPLWPL